ncbi:MAG: hypothetical protein ACYCXI_03465 [Dethiobacteraceae bacterium]
MKKRKPRRNPISQLDLQQEFDLVLGEHRRPAFESALQRRAAWYTHRDRLIKESAEEIPGSRPQAFWEFEHLEIREFDGEKWEYLLQNSLLLDGEQAGITANWIDYLQRHTEYLALNSVSLEPYRRQAALLGEIAQEALAKLQKKKE